MMQWEKRCENAAYLTEKLKDCKGLVPQTLYDGPKSGSFYLYALGYRKEYFNNVHRNVFLKALAAEGIPGFSSCHIYHIDIPDDIAIMGVDNDELMCNISDPPLSSIALDVENGGYRAARLLDQLIKKEITKPFNVIVDPLVIIKRNSTEKYAVSNKYIHNVLEYIENNYAETIAVSNLVDLVPMSRRVLERVFKANTGLTIHQYIQNFRIEHFKNLLLSTDLPLSEAASKSGFEDVKNVSRVFRKYSEFSPAEYRRKCRFLSYNSNDALNEYE